MVLTDDGIYDEWTEHALAIADWTLVWLRVEVDRSILQFSVSADGKRWQPMGPALDASKLSDDYGAGLRFTGVFVGLCAQDVGSAGPGETYYGYANVASSLADQSLIARAQQGLADHQFIDSFRPSETALFFPEDFAKLKAQRTSTGKVLPTTPGQPDFAWADEQNAVLSIKHGLEQHFVTFARRANSIHHIGDAHSITPEGERVVQFWIDDVRFTPSSEVEKIGPEVQSDFTGSPPDKPVNAWAGQEQPKARGEHGPPGGLADFYSVRYGNYLIAMNCAFGKSFKYKPDGVSGGRDLVSGRPVRLPMQLAPQSTVVFYAPVSDR